MTAHDAGIGTSLPGSRVLLVSNDREASNIWAFALRQIGLDPALTDTSAEALEWWSSDTFDLALIDVHGPDLDGIRLVGELRARAVNPIILFTPDGGEMHVIEAYRAGVDECVTKPVSPSLFVHKVRAWLRRSWTMPARALERLQSGPLSLDPARRELTTENGPTIKLTNLEFRVLYLLMRHRGHVLPSDLIVDRVWGVAGGGDGTLLKNVIYRLRQKMEPASGSPRFLRTVPGEGYVFHVD